MGDQDDKLWLYENGHMPMTGGKVRFEFVCDERCLCKGECFD